MTSNASKPEAIEEWGAHCYLSTCNSLDFLPFKCQHCQELFCADHYRPLLRESEGGHVCRGWDENKADARVPSCPLCATPISIPLGQDPNIAMDTHLTNSCPVLNSSTGLARDDSSQVVVKVKKASNVCQKSKCQTKMLVPITCSDCTKKFCTPHRFPSDHQCNPVKKVSDTNQVGVAIQAQQRAALAAVKRAMAQRPKLPKAAIPSKTKEVVDDDVDAAKKEKRNLLPPALGLRKTDRRAKAEEESRLKSLEFRAKKGILTEQEKVTYATELARIHATSNENKDCTIC